VYEFSLKNGGWNLVSNFTAAGTQPKDWFGWAVKIDGNTAVVGSPYHGGKGNKGSFSTTYTCIIFLCFE
jgi:hypothetical protein